MPHYKAACVREQGIDLIIIPLDDAFGRQLRNEQNAFIVELQTRASAAGLPGTVVPVWNDGADEVQGWTEGE